MTHTTMYAVLTIVGPKWPVAKVINAMPSHIDVLAGIHGFGDRSIGCDTTGYRIEDAKPVLADFAPGPWEWMTSSEARRYLFNPATALV